jgi:uncharacterized membrane protein
MKTRPITISIQNRIIGISLGLILVFIGLYLQFISETPHNHISEVTLYSYGFIFIIGTLFGREVIQE